VQTSLDKLLRETIGGLATAGAWSDLDLDPQLERTKDPRHGDFTSNIAMRLAKAVGLSPRELASRIVAAMPASSDVEKLEIAGPGFINITLTFRAYFSELLEVLLKGDKYGRSDAGQGRRILVEYVSANPTGPLHVGHGRHAAYGATVANLLRATGHTVDEEYYVNDAGRQMDILAVSVWLRYAEICGAEFAFPANCYQGDYCREIAAAVKESSGDGMLGEPASIAAALESSEGDDEQRLDALIATVKAAIGADAFSIFFEAALDEVLEDIRDDLSEFGVKPQRWYSEQSLADSGLIKNALRELDERKLLYRKGGATWFRTSQFGDDKDRVVVRENGATTYFASDIAYHREKCERGYSLLVNVLGADHHGYVPRLRAALEGLGKPPEQLEVDLVQFVALFRGKEKVQMSTRAGTYVTLRELREEVGNDAARFLYVSRSNDQHLDFDLELAKTQSNDNPVYYVQYAHARIASMLRKLPEDGFAPPEPALDSLESLRLPEEKALLASLSGYGEVVELASAKRAPQMIVNYSRELAADFHSYYNAHRIIADDGALRDGRILLAMGVRQVIANALRLLGVAAPEKM